MLDSQFTHPDSHKNQDVKRRREQQADMKARAVSPSTTRMA